jgi:hypothetical protein
MDVTVYENKFKAVYNPWRADLFTARLSTGVSSIETYSEFPRICGKYDEREVKVVEKLTTKQVD